MDKHELADRVGVSIRTIERWLKIGCPHARDAMGQLVFDEHAVRAWARDRDLLRGRPDPNVESRSLLSDGPVATRENLTKAEIARKISIVRRNELEIAAEKGLKGLDLAQRIREAGTLDELNAIGREVAALVASGSLVAARATALRQLLGDARRGLLAAARDSRGDDDDRVVLCSTRGLRVLQAFEALVSDARQARVEAFVAAELEQDLQEQAAGPGEVTP
ncbi:MAG: terminase small subunit [Planctomycetes bacterium]|nr:terminase small subunit [Planctomycetota bacterium]